MKADKTRERIATHTGPMIDGSSDNLSEAERHAGELAWDRRPRRGLKIPYASKCLIDVISVTEIGQIRPKIATAARAKPITSTRKKLPDEIRKPRRVTKSMMARGWLELIVHEVQERAITTCCGVDLQGCCLFRLGNSLFEDIILMMDSCLSYLPFLYVHYRSLISIRLSFPSACLSVLLTGLMLGYIFSTRIPLLL
jgi:hypothetical protein